MGFKSAYFRHTRHLPLSGLQPEPPHQNSRINYFFFRSQIPIFHSIRIRPSGFKFSFSPQLLEPARPRTTTHIFSPTPHKYHTLIPTSKFPLRPTHSTETSHIFPPAFLPHKSSLLWPTPHNPPFSQLPSSCTTPKRPNMHTNHTKHGLATFCYFPQLASAASRAQRIFSAILLPAKLNFQPRNHYANKTLATTTTLRARLS